MTNNKAVNINRNEELFEAILKVAAKEVMQKEMEQLFNELDEMDDIQPSDILDKKVRKMIARESRTYQRKKSLRSWAKIAAIFVGIVFAGTFTLLTIEASRNYVLNVIFGIRDDHVVVEFDLGSGDRPSEGRGNVNEMGGLEVSGIVFGYVPEGFEVVTYHEVGVMTIIVFSDGDERQIVVSHSPSQGLMTFTDNEAREFSVIYLTDGQKAFLFEANANDYNSTITWYRGIDVFSINAHLNTSGLLRMAENIFIR